MYKDKDNTIIVKFITKKADLLAALITYGNRQVKGSKILSIAFGRKENYKQKTERSLQCMALEYYDDVIAAKIKK